MNKQPYIARPSWSGNSVRRRGLRCHAICIRPRWSGYVAAAGFTLLEIILSLAILAGSLVALGEVMRLGDQNAISARDETHAEILASGVMDELLAKAREFKACTNQEFDYEMEAHWVYSILIEPTNVAQVVRVGVRVEQPVDSEKEPLHYELYRWIVNPDYETQLADEEAQIAATAEEAATRAATPPTSTTSGTSVTGTGGSTGTTGR